MTADKLVSGNRNFTNLLIFYNIMFFVFIVMMALGVRLSHNRDDSLARLGALYLLFGLITGAISSFFFIFDVLVEMRKRRNTP